MVLAKKFIYVNRFVGEPKPTDFRLEEETLPALKDGGLLILTILVIKLCVIIIISFRCIGASFIFECGSVYAGLYGTVSSRCDNDWWASWEVLKA